MRGRGSGCSCAAARRACLARARDVRALPVRGGGLVTAPAKPADRLSDILERWEPVIGIEVHCQLRTASKMFCACSTAYDGAAPNTHPARSASACPALPVINRAAVEHVLATGVAIGGTIPGAPDGNARTTSTRTCPKGYQISQYAMPLAADGSLTVDTSDGPFEVRIRRAHLEEDTAKLIHAETGGRRVSLVDFNRSGTPLMEIVTEPVVRTADRRAATPRSCSCCCARSAPAMPTWSAVRCGSRPTSPCGRGADEFGTRVEVKNMNSFRSVERAIAFEIERQATALEAGEPLVQETRGWDDGRQATYRMRLKETSEDYRYFPEPDLPPLTVDPAGWPRSAPRCRSCRRRAVRGMPRLGLSGYDAAVLVADPAMTVAFEAIRAAGPELPAKDVANLVTGDYGRAAKVRGARTRWAGRSRDCGGARGPVGADRRRVAVAAECQGGARRASRDRRVGRRRSSTVVACARSATRRPWTRSSTRCWRPTHRRSRTGVPADRRRSASLSAR